MRFTVTWLPYLVDYLADLWNTKDPKAITRAADMMDLLLKDDPLESLTPVDELYFLRIDPLLVICEVSEGDRAVTVIDLVFFDLHTRAENG